MQPSTDGPLAGLLAAIERELPDAVELRHRLHARPELAHAEEWTAASVEAEMPVGCATVAGTGRVALVGEASGMPVAVRAELDGLPLQERTGAEFSARGELMHACGHDVHMAALVALARAAHSLASTLPAPLPAQRGGLPLRCRAARPGGARRLSAQRHRGRPRASGARLGAGGAGRGHRQRVL